MLRYALVYGAAGALLIAGIWLSQYSIAHYAGHTGLLVGISAVVLLGTGIWLGIRSRKKSGIPASPPGEAASTVEDIPLPPPDEVARQLGISPRETEVLQFLAKGLSNQQIADELYVSLNTVKTHTGKIYLKLEVSNRTSAIAKARKIGLIR